MTTGTRDLMRCPDGQVHAWVYLGKKSARYRCQRCPVEVSKEELKEATDA